MHKIRVILDTEEDVFRTFLVDENINLEQFHTLIATAFGFNGLEMASFYRADETWNQGEEIPLFDMSDAGTGMSMQNSFVFDTLPNKGSKLIYVYDFMSLWTFFVDVIAINSDEENTTSKVILQVGEVPKQAPEKNFTAENNSSDFGDIDEDFGHFDDDFDFNEY